MINMLFIFTNAAACSFRAPARGFSNFQIWINLFFSGFTKCVDSQIEGKGGKQPSVYLVFMKALPLDYHTKLLILLPPKQGKQI